VIMQSVTGARRALLGVMAAGLVAAGCGGAGASKKDLVVVSTVAPLVDLVSTVAGDRAEVRGLIPAGENGHTYQPRPSDARRLSGADLFIDNGLGLNQSVSGFAIENLSDKAQITFLGDFIPQSGLIGAPGSCHEGHCHGPVNAHIWPDPKYAAAYVDGIARTLSGVDPKGEGTYRKNAEQLNARINELHTAITTATATVPEVNRKLVVYHDAWAYFARRYGYQMIGALQVANFAEPSAGEVRAMIDQIRTEAVPAFFGSEVFPSDVLRAVEEEARARYVPELADDRLPGKPGEPLHSYVGMMLTNAKLVVENLGGDIAALAAFERSMR
jgi:ABC-type Zn uptake system ZnuABC Zn-binding protein ZnuA